MATVLGFPSVNSPFVNENGTIQQGWLQLLMALWQRTGSGGGTAGDQATFQALALESPDDPVNTDLLQGLGMGYRDDPEDPVNTDLLQGLGMGYRDDAPDEQSRMPEAGVTVGASPFVFQANVPGHLLVQGGTVSVITIMRDGATAYTTGLTVGFIPLSKLDQATVTYSVLPTLTFFPW